MPNVSSAYHVERKSRRPGSARIPQTSRKIKMAKKPLSELTVLIGQEESLTLEFKSSRELASQDNNARQKFIRDKIVVAVSAMLNSEGGRIVIGLEEDRMTNKNARTPDVASKLSEGVPGALVPASILETQITSNIRPSCASYVTVDHVPLNNDHGDSNRLAYIVNVRPGITAYQASNNLYYARRNFSNEPMEDKDIRLRMLANDKPRAALRTTISIRPTIEALTSQVTNYEIQIRDAIAQTINSKPLSEPEILERLQNNSLAFIDLPYPPTITRTHYDWNIGMQCENVGLVTIRHARLTAHLEASLLDKQAPHPEKKARRLDIEFSFDGTRTPTLFPETAINLEGFTGTLTNDGSLSELESLPLKATLYLDNGPAVRLETDLARDFTELISGYESDTKLLQERIDAARDSLRQHLEGRKRPHGASRAADL
jgi:hypothetical protein